MASTSFKMSSYLLFGRVELVTRRGGIHSLGSATSILRPYSYGMTTQQPCGRRFTGEVNMSFPKFSTSSTNAPKQKIISNTAVTSTHVTGNKVTGPRTMPTRHSRHHFPQVASFTELQTLTDEILTADPGSLFGTLFKLFPF